MNEAHIRLPQSIEELKPKDIRRFWAKVKRKSPETCWEWQASTDEGGYGKLAFGKLLMGAHRLSYLIHRGRLTGGVVMHSCDNPLGVNPAHLSMGTHTMNSADRCRKGRQARGSSHSSAKLTEEQVGAIRQKRAAGIKLRVIAAEFGVSTSVVSGIESRRYWRHLA